MSNYLVQCDGCGKPQIVDNTSNFKCDNCGFEACTISERPNPTIGKEVGDFWEDLIRNGPDKVQE